MPHYAKHRQKGFTIQEMLIVVLITVILLAMSMIGIVTYSRYLRITELDNSAKGIFMAAQNRAILLSTSHRLEEYVINANNQMDGVEVFPGAGNSSTMTAYYIHSDDLKNGKSELLPKDTIDPQLWDGDFYIIYEPKSASVVDVFFNKSKLPVESDFPSFYKKWRTQPRKVRMKSKPMIGYYGGQSAKGSDTISLEPPTIKIENTNTLTVAVTYRVPRKLQMAPGSGKVVLDTKLNYEGVEFQLSNEDAKLEQGKPEIAYFPYTYTWTLDSLTDPKYRFHKLFSKPGTQFVYGKDFKIDANVSYNGTLDGVAVNSAHNTATDNSLFAKGSGKDVALIGYLRHLQNLDKVFSHVDEKISAKQLNDIYNVEGYTFCPISNTVLQSYDGVTYAIHDLNIGDRVNDTTIEKNTDSAGLFGTFIGNGVRKKELKNIRLINTSVHMTKPQGATGVLLGTGAQINLTNCQVYWENKSDQANNLRDILGSDNKLNYQANGAGITGGLAGKLTDAAVTNCAASTLVNTPSAAGGLIGQTSNVSVTGSYADAYLQSPAAAGLIGSAMDNTSITKSYAVGFINSPNKNGQMAKAAGLSLGDKKVKVSDAYSAMLFTTGTHNFPLCQSGGTYQRTYYLGLSSLTATPEDKKCERSYAELTDPAKWQELFGKDVFTVKSAVTSHPYNLQTAMSLNTFIYPGLKELDHWGDWGERFQDGSLVYYECYKDKNSDTLYYGFSGGSVNHLRTDKPIVMDGYAIAYKQTALDSNMKLTVTYETAAGKTAEKTLTYTKDTAPDMLLGGPNYPIYEVNELQNNDGEDKDAKYRLYPLSPEMVNVEYAPEHFYHKIKIKETENSGEPRQYYYNPHFANTALPYEEDMDLAKKSERLAVEVRTPRHLYMLSRFPEYYTSNHQYRFQQHRDLIYSVYKGYDLFTGDQWTQAPIGLNQAQPFRGSYYGNEYIIHGVRMKATNEKNKLYPYMGLFGYSTSTLRDIVYRMDLPKPETGEKPFTFTINQQGSRSDVIYAGGLVGFNGGTVENCAVAAARFQANCYNYSTVYLGGLVGLNKGRIHASSVDVDHLKADASMSHIYAGGFVGRNGAGATIDQCYAVGRVSAARARYGNVYACGFAGRNEATLNRSYAAMDLAGEGGAKTVGFCPDQSAKSVYLNAGNFTYRDKHFPAQYDDAHATPVTWEQLTGNDPTPSEAVKALGMHLDLSSPTASADHADRNYPYPGIVQKENKAIHHGEWPDRMKLGTMGVYYWEKMNDFYYFNVLSQNNGQVVRSSTLPVAHGDGHFVTEYGYGYFHETGTDRPLIQNKEVYWDMQNTLFDPQGLHENETNGAVNDALSVLMGHKYKFYSFNTWEENSQKGLHLIATAENQTRTVPPVGTWMLTQGGNTMEVVLNPLFADAMALKTENVPGTKEKPYQIRSIEQLQFINWYALGDKKTVNHIAESDGQGYLFLSNSHTGANGRQYVWEQTHDLNGAHIKNYTPIAGIRDLEADGTLTSWFSGGYNGNDYAIQEVSISTNGINTTALFGVTVNAELQNIVMYSPSGKATLTATNSSKAWYGMGGLVGLAANTAGSDRSIKNCTVAGYTIIDRNREAAWGGGGVGGLVGICNMALQNCSAVNDIVLDFTHSDPDRNVRVGGIAGSCQKSISSCYSGGTIKLGDGFKKDTTSHLHVGGITGGYFMKTLNFSGGFSGTIEAGLENNKVPRDKITHFTNCYTYVNITEDVKDRCQHIEDPVIKERSNSLYVIGGLGEIASIDTEHPKRAIYENCYYLYPAEENRNVLDLNAPGTQNCSYADLAVGGKVFNFFQGVGFGTVTTTTKDNAPIDGRYSFGVHPSLLGKNYPFPTILTQTSEVAAGGRANVHYGDWPLSGIRREYGALPVNFDLFADYKTAEGGAVWEEALTLSGITDTNGNWNVKCEDTEDGRKTPVLDAQILAGTSASTRKLQLTAKREGSTLVTVTYTVGGETYTLPIEVTVTAELRVAPKSKAPLIVFTNQILPENDQSGQKPIPTAQIPMELRDKNDKRIPDDLRLGVPQIRVESDSDYFLSAALEQDTQNRSDLTLRATTAVQTGSTQMTVRYSFRYLNEVYNLSSALILRVADHEKTLSEQKLVFEPDQQEPIIRKYTADSFLNELNDGNRPITDLKITAFEPLSAAYQKIVNAEWDANDQGTPIVGTLKLTARPQAIYPAVVPINVQFQFNTDADSAAGFAGNTHTLWKTLTIKLEKKPDPVPPTPEPPVPPAPPQPEPQPEPQPQPEEGQP